MTSLSLSALILAPTEEVYQYVTAYGNDGPLDDAFQAKYGKVVSNQTNVYVTRENEGRDGDEGGREITWSSTFEYPTRRVMKAVNSRWANRVDVFRPVRGGTKWSIRWDTRVGGIRGAAQYLVFRLMGQRRFRRTVVDPVKRYFEGSQ